MKPLNILIVTSSQIIAGGLHATLQRMRTLSTGDICTIEPDKVADYIEKNPARLLLIDPIGINRADLDSLRKSLPQATLVAICSCLLPKEYTKSYDYTLSIYDNPSSLADIIGRMNTDAANNEDTKSLSQREKELVVGIVKGLSNKEIAAEMNVSVNTVMTHRRNITAKLQIHSAAGLTIYAIVSKLVRLDEISTHLPV